MTLENELEQRFGFGSFRPGQAAVIEHLLAGRSAAAVFPTGGGKSICYQLPAQLLDGLTLVVSPLIALMKDQIDALRARGIAAERLDSTLDRDRARAVMQQARDGSLRLLYIAPERFNNERFREQMAQVPVALFAVDEAHCISEWGHNFRPDYLKLAGFARSFGAERVLALTATATDAVLSDIMRIFEIAPECAIRTPFYRANLSLLLRPLAATERDRALVASLAERPAGPTIVYVTLQRTAELLAARLVREGHDARHYHAGMDPQVRAETQDWFIGSDRGVVVATIAFGMGIDKANIRYVYHHNPPKSLENYAQEIGRAGRDGDAAICEAFICPEDLGALENFAYGDTPTVGAVTDLVHRIVAEEHEFDVSLTELASSTDIRPLVLRTLLTYLELDGYLRGGTPFYANYRFKPHRPSKEILAHFEGQHRQFLVGVFANAVKAKTWFSLDVDETGRVLGVDRHRIVRALEDLDDRELIELSSAGVRLRFTRLKVPPDAAALAVSLFERCLAREAAELERLGQVVHLATLDGCQVAALSAHFGEHREEACGHCSWCLGSGTRASLPVRPTPVVNEAAISAALALHDEHPQLLENPRVLARLLCGLPSPRITKLKLKKSASFGALEGVPFGVVLERLEEAHARRSEGPT